MALKSTRYKNNPFLPRAGFEQSFSSFETVELAKCVADPVYFAKTYFKIIDLDHGYVPFNLYDYQEEFVRKFETNRNIVAVQCRQSGKTAGATVVLLHAALYVEKDKPKKIAILANKAPTAQEILKRIKTAYELLPDFLKPGVKVWNEKKIEFDNGSIIMAEASSSDNIRGQSIHILLLDELAFIENWEDFSASVLPTLSSGKETKLIFLSTPNGLNHFYDYVEGARAGTNDFALVEVPWWRVPGRDEAWMQKTLAELNFDQQKFDQEYSLEFLGSSGTLINGATLRRMQPETPISKDEHLQIFGAPKKDGKYVLVADTSRGKGLDYSAFSVIDITQTPFKQICVYRNNMINPTDYAAIVYRIAKHYNNAFTLIELNDLGSQVADLLYDTHEYENLLMTENKGRGGKQISFGGKAERGITLAFNSRATGCAMLKAMVEQNKLLITDKHTIDEFKVFSKKNDKYQAEPGKHDDMVMGLVSFGWLTEQSYFIELTETNVLEALREQTDEELDDFMLSFGIVTTGLEHSYYDNNGVPEISYDDFTNWMFD